MANKASDNLPKALQDFFKKHRGIHFTRLQWVDFSGVLRTRIVTISRLFGLASGQSTYALAQNCMIFPISTAPDCFPEGPELWQLHPDWTSLKPLAFAPKHASVMCAVSRHDSRQSFARCPRTRLLDLVQSFEQKHETRVTIGFEIEFVLLTDTLEFIKPLDRIIGYSMTAGLRGETMELLEEVTAALEAAKISVYHIHTENPDQLELALGPSHVVEAIDSLMFAQETIRSVALRYGHKASMSVTPVLQGPQNGCHMHLSLSNKALEEQFLAGVLRKLKPLCAFGMANYDSYARVIDDGAGLFVGWGTENRDLPIRKTGASRWEFRILDATANVYLFAAACLAAGSDGIQHKYELTWKDCTFPPEPGEKRLEDCGIHERMPTALSATLKSVRDDEDLPLWLGPELVEHYLRVKEKEAEIFPQMSDEERRRRYLDYF